MAHEVSETIQDPDSGKWVNVYGKGTRKAGQRLPEDDSGEGHGEYDSVEEAVDAAKKRSAVHGEHEEQFKRGFERINKKKVPGPAIRPLSPRSGGVRA